MCVAVSNVETANLSFKARVVLVGRTGLDDVARKLRGSEVLRVRTPIEAIAEVALPTDAETPRRVVVVIGTDAALAVEEFGDEGDGAAEFLRGLQTIHPRARLLRAVPRGFAGDGASGYHGIVPVDATAIEFVAAFTQASRQLGAPERTGGIGGAAVAAPGAASGSTSGSPSGSRASSAQVSRQVSDEDPDAFFAQVQDAAGSSVGGLELQLAEEEPETVAPVSIRPSSVSASVAPVADEDADAQDAAVSARSVLDDFAAYPSVMMAPGGVHIESFSSVATPIEPEADVKPLTMMIQRRQDAGAAPAGGADKGERTAAEAEGVRHPKSEPAGAVSAAVSAAMSTAVGAGSVPASASDRVLAALLAGRDVRGEALAVIRESTGDASVMLTDPTDALPGVPVEHEGRVMAKLRGRVAADVLAPHAQWMARWVRLDDHVAELREWAFTDALTGALNRRYFEMFLDESVGEARRVRRSLSILVFDIDNFKRWNDENGHLAGDEILVETVKLLKSVVRPTDKVCRIGGDEFAVIFYEPDGPRDPGSRHPDDVHQIAVRFQQQVRNKRFPKLATTNVLAISGGLATFPWDARTAAELVKVADERALQCKRSGKNAIVFGEERPR